MSCTAMYMCIQVSLNSGISKVNTFLCYFSAVFDLQENHLYFQTKIMYSGYFDYERFLSSKRWLSLTLFLAKHCHESSQTQRWEQKEKLNYNLYLFVLATNHWVSCSYISLMLENNSWTFFCIWYVMEISQ